MKYTREQVKNLYLLAILKEDLQVGQHLFIQKNIKAIVAIESGGPAAENSIEYKELLSQKIPIAFYFGDYIENGDLKILSTSIWKERLEKCKNFVKNYNDEGGNSVLFELSKEGIFGNDHFIFQNLNNDIVADHVEKWIKGL